jgi:hypothetical protein
MPFSLWEMQYNMIKNVKRWYRGCRFLIVENFQLESLLKTFCPDIRKSSFLIHFFAVDCNTFQSFHFISWDDPSNGTGSADFYVTKISLFRRDFHSVKVGSRALRHNRERRAKRSDRDQSLPTKGLSLAIRAQLARVIVNKEITFTSFRWIMITLIWSPWIALSME